MRGEIVGGAAAGLVIGVVLRRADLCFHSMFRGLLDGRRHLAVTWTLGVGVAAVGLSLVYALSDWDQLNRGLPFDPVGNVLGGLLTGIGMVVALSCASGLFYKLGAGMLGALVGLGGWFAGDVLARDVDVPGPRVLDGGEDGTLPGVLGSALPMDVPGLAVALVVLAVLLAMLSKLRPAVPKGGWAWPAAGVSLGVATIIAWMLAGWSDASFGPSTVGAPGTVVDGFSGDGWGNVWQVAFLVGIIAGSAVWSARSGRLWIRGEDLPRYAGLAIGGLLLGIGGRVAGGCNLGHGLSGVAQMNIGSYVAVASMGAGVALTATAFRMIMPRVTARQVVGTDWRADARATSTGT